MLSETLRALSDELATLAHRGMIMEPMAIAVIGQLVGDLADSAVELEAQAKTPRVLKVIKGGRDAG